MLKNIAIEHANVYDFIISLSRIANHEADNDFLEKHKSDWEERFKLDESLTKWTREIKGKIPQNYLDDINLMFNNETRFSAVLLYYARRERCLHIADFIAFMQGLQAREFFANYLYLYSLHKTTFPQISYAEALSLSGNENAAMRFVEKLPFQAKRKWEILQFCLKPETTFASLCNLLLWYYGIYKKDEAKVEKIVQKYEAELTCRIKKYGKDYISLLINIDYIKQDKSIILAVSYFGEIGYLYVSVDAEEDLFLIGYRHMEVYVERKHGILANVLIFKALGDETRQNMLKLLSQKEWYGDELAQKMGLSNSTVSYHLNILLMEGFIKINRIENRTYISLLEKNIEKSLQTALKRILEQKN